MNLTPTGLPGIELRPGTPEDYRAIARVDGIAFGYSYSEAEFADVFEGHPPKFTLAWEGERLVGITGEHRFRMTVPGGSLNVPGITWVSVLPTYRRRGVLRALLQNQLDRFAAAGDPAAVLTASEAGIYGRFGFGPSTEKRRVSVDRRSVRLRVPVDAGDVEFLSPEAALNRLPGLHDRWAQQVPGALSRDKSWWDYLFTDRADGRDGMTEKFYLVHPDGYLSYRVREQWTNGHADNRCEIVDYRCVTPSAHAALWQVLLSMDLITTIETWELPTDDPLPYLVDDSRQIRIVASNDGMWLRPVDPAALLSGRRYQLDIAAVLEVEGQRHALDGGPDGASCQPTGRPADVRLDLAALGSIYLGTHRVSTLARAGRIQAGDESLLRRLDLCFLADQAASHGTAF